MSGDLFNSRSQANTQSGGWAIVSKPAPFMAVCAGFMAALNSRHAAREQVLLK